MSSVLFICSMLTPSTPITVDYYSPTVTSVPLPQSHRCQSCAGATPTSPSRKISSEAQYYNALTTESCIHQMDTTNRSTLSTYTLQIKAISQPQRGVRNRNRFFPAKNSASQQKLQCCAFKKQKLFNYVKIINSYFYFLTLLLFYGMVNYQHWYYLFTILKYQRPTFILLKQIHCQIPDWILFLNLFFPWNYLFSTLKFQTLPQKGNGVSWAPLCRVYTDSALTCVTWITRG